MIAGKKQKNECVGIVSVVKRCVDKEAHQTSHDGREVAEQRRTLGQGRAKDDEEPKGDKDDEEPKGDKGRRGR